MHQNEFGGQAPTGPAGGACSVPPGPLATRSEGRGVGKGKRMEGKGQQGEGEGRGRGRRKVEEPPMSEVR